MVIIMATKIYRGEKKYKFNIFPYLCLVPVFTFLILFLVRPFVFAFIKSFYDYDAAARNNFIGFGNYITLFRDDMVFRKSVKNLWIFLVFLIPSFAMPILVAEMIFHLKSIKAQNVYRTVMIIPMVVPLVITVLIWKFLYYPSIGLFNRLLSNMHLNEINFLGDEKTVKLSIIMIGFPWVSGLNLLMAFAALQNIDVEMLEAANLDGASGIKRIISIELPLILPQLKTLFIICMCGVIQDYEKILILTNGGPNNASMVPGLHMYSMAFSTENASKFGYSCCIAVVMFAVIFTLSIIMLRIKKKK